MLSIPDLLSIDIAHINYSLYGAVKKLMEIEKDNESCLKRLESLLNIGCYSCDSSNVVVVEYVMSSNLSNITKTCYLFSLKYHLIM